MPLYSYKGQEPKELPDRIRLCDGTTRTSLDKMSQKELESLGFFGPITKPEFDEKTQEIQWIDNQYQVIDFSKKLIEKNQRIEKEENIDYNFFWESFVSGKVYKKLRINSLESLSSNTLLTEFISIFIDAKYGNPQRGRIQHYINVLFIIFDFDSEEIEEFQNLMDKTNLSVLYKIPSKEFICSRIYDPKTNKILESAPFDSWKIVDGEWQSPVQYPSDDKIYKWNEDLVNWIEVK